MYRYFVSRYIKIVILIKRKCKLKVTILLKKKKMEKVEENLGQRRGRRSELKKIKRNGLDWIARDRVINVFVRGMEICRESRRRGTDEKEKGKGVEIGSRGQSTADSETGVKIH